MIKALPPPQKPYNTKKSVKFLPEVDKSRRIEFVDISLATFFMKFGGDLIIVQSICFLVVYLLN